MHKDRYNRLLRRGLMLPAAMTAFVGSAAGAQTTSSDVATSMPDTAGAQAAKHTGENPPTAEAASSVADIVVTGQRLGFSTTSQIKRDAPQSVSVLTTTDLRNIPDTILIDIVRRVPGLQVSQGGGGGVVSIRGLSQTENRLNGRNFPSGIGRNFDVATLPGDLVSGVAVYKTPTADQIEGGIAGIIDFRTRRPFDFDGFAGSFTLKGVYANLDDKVDPVASGYLSNRWDTGLGEVGVLVGGSFQRQRNGLDLLTTNGNTLQTNAGGANIDAPTSVYKRYFFNDKEVSTAYGALQFRPNDELEMVVDVLYNSTSNLGGLQNLSVSLQNGTPTGAFSLHPNSNAFRSGTYRNVPLESGLDVFGGKLDALQAAYNATYKKDGATISFDAAYTRSTSNAPGGGIAMLATAPTVAYDADVRYPSFDVGGIDQTNAANYAFSNFYEYINRDKSDDLALRLDATYEFEGTLRTVQFGLRYDQRDIEHTGGFRGANVPATIGSVPASGLSVLTDDNLYAGTPVTQRQWASFDKRSLSNYIGSTRQLFGTSGAVPDNPASAYDGREKVISAYGMASFATPLLGIPVDGNVGVRVTQTDFTLNGTTNSTTTTNGVTTSVLTPSANGSKYMDVLPSANLRLTLAEELFLRLSYSKQLTRPGFGQLAPVTVLNFQDRIGSSGNPSLKPLRADQLDASLEYYFGTDNSVYVAGFYKDVAGFIRNETTSAAVSGFRITRPTNATDGYVAGAEVGYRQNFAFLPGALSGLGVQGSYTYVDGTRSPNASGYVVPYEQITRHNYQLSGFYRKYGISANVNWVWRSRLLEATSNDPRGRPDYRTPFGQLDANLIYAVSPRVNLIVSGVNLTQSLIRRSFQDERFFAQNALENRRILAGFQVKLGGGI
jgi:TonB-dependent receptor